MNLSSAPEIMTAKQVAKLCLPNTKFGEQTIADRCKRKLIPAQKVGREWLILKESLINYLKGKTR